MIINLNYLNQGGGSGSGTSIEYKVVDELPSSGKVGIIYLVPKETPEEQDAYDEYIWLNDKWEHIGTSKVKLSDYYTKEETDSTFATKEEIPTVPTNVSELTNDAQYITSDAIPTKVSAFENDANYLTEHQSLEDYYTKEETDSTFATKEEIPTVPTNVSAFDNDAQYITLSDIPTQVSVFENDANYQTSTDVASLLEPYATKDEIPTSTSQLSNDSGFITSDEVDTKIVNKADKTELDALSDKVDELQLFKFPNATIFGTPTIQNGQVSNFSNTNYLQFPFLVDFQDREFIIDFSFTTPSDMSGQQNILDSNYGLAFAIRDSRVVMVASENGTSWTTGEIISDEILSPNTTYYFKIMWNMGLFEFRGGLSKDELTINKQTILSKTPYPKTMVIGRSFVSGGNYFKGSINLNDASLTISNKVVWTGMDDVGLATRAAVDLSNLDAKGVEVIDNRIETKLASQTITMVATLEDGSTVTYTLYGIEQQ